MAKSLGINIENKTDSELKQVIEAKFGHSQDNSSDKLTENKFKN